MENNSTKIETNLLKTHVSPLANGGGSDGSLFMGSLANWGLSMILNFDIVIATPCFPLNQLPPLPTLSRLPCLSESRVNSHSSLHHRGAWRFCEHTATSQCPREEGVQVSPSPWRTKSFLQWHNICMEPMYILLDMWIHLSMTFISNTM